ncbi:MAG: CIA30 family protein [Bacteroidota bacterium]
MLTPKWEYVADTVMGGVSEGEARAEKVAGRDAIRLTGTVSLENNGGFSSVRYGFNPLSTEGKSKIYLRVRGDGKNYQFRIRAKAQDYFSYIFRFSTTGEWQEIEIPLTDMYPSFRGRKLDQPNFEADSFEQITFLIANKKKESFKLLIDKVELR